MKKNSNACELFILGYKSVRNFIIKSCTVLVVKLVPMGNYTEVQPQERIDTVVTFEYDKLVYFLFMYTFRLK